ncbi:MAG: hypothetical protein HC802_08770 [Caldilineaceae bacterium]|nr:hypothetical protein [Caldilineaceae bacterium]
MSSTLDRLRRLQGLRAQRQREEPTLPTPPIGYEPSESRAALSARLEEAAPGMVIQNEAGACYLSTHTLAADQERGGVGLDSLLLRTPSAFAPFFRNSTSTACTIFGARVYRHRNDRIGRRRGGLLFYGGCGPV